MRRRCIVPLSQHLEGLVEALEPLARKALARFEPRAVHHARVTTRRLKAAMDLLKPELPRSSRRRFSRALRQLRRRLGPLRDLDVMLKHLREFPDDKRHSVALKWLSGRLAARRRELHRQTSDGKAGASAGGGWRELREEVVALDCESGSLIAKSLTEQLKGFADRAGRLGAAGGGRKGAQDPHAVRIAGKLLRYTLEMAVATGHQFPEAHMKTFKSLQDALGLWHDYVVLTQTAMKETIDTDIAVHDLALHRAVLGLIEACSKQADQHLAEFRRLWGRQGAVLAADIRALAKAAGSPTYSGRRQSA